MEISDGIVDSLSRPLSGLTRLNLIILIEVLGYKYVRVYYLVLDYNRLRVNSNHLRCHIRIQLWQYGIHLIPNIVNCLINPLTCLIMLLLSKSFDLWQQGWLVGARFASWWQTSFRVITPPEGSVWASKWTMHVEVYLSKVIGVECLVIIFLCWCCQVRLVIIFSVFDCGVYSLNADFAISLYLLSVQDGKCLLMVKASHDLFGSGWGMVNYTSVCQVDAVNSVKCSFALPYIIHLDKLFLLGWPLKTSWDISVNSPSGVGSFTIVFL